MHRIKIVCKKSKKWIYTNKYMVITHCPVRERKSHDSGCVVCGGQSIVNFRMLGLLSILTGCDSIT